MLDSVTIHLLTGKFLVGCLLFIRISGMMIAAPFFKNQNVIPHLKLMLTLILAVIMTSAFWQEQPDLDFHLWYLVLLAVKEFMVGVAIGFSANLVFFAARFAGGLLDFDMGYQTASMFGSDDSPTLLGEFNELIALMVFLAINGHHYLIEGIFISVRAVPITTFAVTESTYQLLVKMATTVLIIGIKIAAPVLIALFLTNLALALLARVAPQTNIFILSFQLKIVVGLLVLLASAPLLVYVTKYAMEQMQTEIMRILLTLNPARV